MVRTPSKHATNGLDSFTGSPRSRNTVPGHVVARIAQLSSHQNQQDDPSSVVNQIPQENKNMFGSLGFAKYADDNEWYPALVVSPFDVTSQEVLSYWEQHFQQYGPAEIYHLVCWLGFGNYGLISSDSFVSLEMAMHSNYNESLEKKCKEGDPTIAYAMQLMDELQGLSPLERRQYMSPRDLSGDLDTKDASDSLTASDNENAPEPERFVSGHDAAVQAACKPPTAVPSSSTASVSSYSTNTVQSRAATLKTADVQKGFGTALLKTITSLRTTDNARSTKAIHKSLEFLRTRIPQMSWKFIQDEKVGFALKPVKAILKARGLDVQIIKDIKGELLNRWKQSRRACGLPVDDKQPRKRQQQASPVQMAARKVQKVKVPVKAKTEPNREEGDQDPQNLDRQIPPAQSTFHVETKTKQTSYGTIDDQTQMREWLDANRLPGSVADTLLQHGARSKEDVLELLEVDPSMYDAFPTLDRIKLKRLVSRENETSKSTN